MKKKLKKNQTKGITLIALVITIIVLLILAAISITMLTGDNSILKRAAEAKELTDKSQIVEQARLDILGEIAGKKGENPTETKIKEILVTYFTSDTIPEDLSDLNQNMTTKSGGYTVKLSEVLDGVTVKQEVKETPIKKSTEKTDSYVGYYADINNDGKVDGIIYADMVVGNTKSGRWNNDDWSAYNVTTIADVTTVKDYVVSTRTYEGQTEAGKYKANDGLGINEVLVPATNSTGTKDRFYVMALENFKTTDYETFYWYKSANGKLDDTIETSAIDFGEGKAKTIKEINRWNAKSYGDQDTRDLWGVIQDKIEKKEEDGEVVDCKWFIPSKAEWSAFGEELEITSDNYVNKGLSSYYWSSSQSRTNGAYGANFGNGFMNNFDVYGNYYVRLSTTF